MALTATDLSINTHVMLEGDASLNVGGTTLLNGVVDMESDLRVDGDVSLNSHLFVANDVSFNQDLKVYGTIDVSNGINAFTSSVIAKNFTGGSVNQFDLEVDYSPEFPVGGEYIHFSVGFQVTGDISQNSGRTVQF